jgi:Rne/Rng family ribonuclease
MSKELVISANRRETRVAILEDDQVVEVYHQRENEYSLAGSIHKGKVTRVLPGMQSAFVDIGLDRDAFLYVSDFFEDNEEYDKIVTSVEEKVLKLDRTAAPATASVEVETAPAAAPESSAAVAATEFMPVAAQAAAPGSAAPAAEQRWEDRERRGRRGRRRRGQKGRAPGLPDSKFYSPSAGRTAPETEPVLKVVSDAPLVQAEGTPVAAVTPAADLLILPGESLAKYRRPQEEEGEDPAPGPDARARDQPAEGWIEESAQLPAAEAEREPHSVPSEDLGAASPEAAPQSELGAAELLEPLDSAAPAEAEPEGVTERGTGIEAPTEAGVAETEAGAPAIAVTQREHGAHYPHRLSRRMRRKARAGTAEPVRPGHHEARLPDTTTRVTAEVRTAPNAALKPERATASISDLLKEGQEIIVQIAKEPLGQKGARITSHIALPGRFLVYMPTVDHIGVSRKIPSDDERSRLKRILQTHRTGIPGGFIVRTAGDGHTEEELRADMMFLYNLWLDLRQKAERKPAPALLHHDLNVVERVLRDQLTSSFKNIWVDNEEIYESVLQFVQRFQPAMVSRVKLYTRPNPIFEEFNVTSELEKALRPKVWLKSGGYIVINQTEALVAIDVNTGKFVGKSNRLEDTIVKTNTDAIKEIVRQIRLRDLGGIIVVDFIDMDERKNRQKVMQTLEEAMRTDKAPYKILQFNDFGLVAITRKRVKQSLERTLCTPCPYCEGAGYVKSAQTVVAEILQEAHKIARDLEGNDVMLRVSPEVAKLLKSSRNTYLQELEEVLGRTVFVKSDAMLHQEKFDLA